MLTAEREEESPQGGVINCGLRSGGNGVGESGGDRHVYRIVVARAGMAHTVGRPYLKIVMRAMPLRL